MIIHISILNTDIKVIGRLFNRVGATPDFQTVTICYIYILKQFLLHSKDFKPYACKKKSIRPENEVAGECLLR